MWSLEHWQYACLRAVVNTSLYVRTSPWLAPATQPDRIRTYPCRPNLHACRIFLPRGRTGILPLVIRAHGGGFIVNNPAADDIIARHLSDKAQCVVVSIDYGKAPQNQFPSAYEDVIAQSLAAIHDPDLPLDHERPRVVLCGSSAGGNLVLAAAQDSRLRPVVMGVAGIYPPVDLDSTEEAKMATRPDPSVPDFIGKSYSSITRLYFNAAQPPSLKDPRLSPAYFATRDSLPPNILLIGSEHDMFCHEDEVMANKLASSQEAKVTTKNGWRAPGVQWHKVYGQPHAFDAFRAKTPEQEKARLAAVDEMYSVISEWVIDVFPRSDRQ